MKKKLLTAAVLSALTISTATAFANPAFSGDAKIEYTKNDDQKRVIENRIRLNIDADIDNDFYVHGRVVMNNNIDQNDSDVKFDQAYLGFRLKNADVKAGKQSLFLGKGLLADVDGLTGVQASTNFDGINLAGFTGKDNENSTGFVNAVDFGTTSGVVNFGASYLNLRDGDNTYYAINADTKIADGVVLNAEYVKNTDKKANGYLAEVKFGNAVKKGDIDYSLIYRNIEAGAVSGYVTEGNYADSKGFKVGTSYKVTDNSTLEASYDFAENESNGADKNQTNVKFTVNF